MSFWRPFAYGQVSIGATATKIYGVDNAANGIIITNSGSSTVYLGDANVTTANGFALAASATVSLPTTSAIYGVTSSTGTIGYMQFE